MSSEVSSIFRDLRGKEGEKPIIAVLTSFDAPNKHNELVEFLNNVTHIDHPIRKKLEKFWFMFSGGSFNRLFGYDDEDTIIQIEMNQKFTRLGSDLPKLNSEAKKFLKARSTCLPNYQNGGITILSYLISKNLIKIIWPFFTPLTSHSASPANFALTRLCNVKGVKQLEDVGEIKEWLRYQADFDAEQNCQPVPFGYLELESGKEIQTTMKKGCVEKINVDVANSQTLNLQDVEINPTLALVSDKESVETLKDFVIEHKQAILSSFDTLLTIPFDDPIKNIFKKEIKKKEITVVEYDRIEQGGYVQIASEILFGRCDYVVVFRDAMAPQQYPPDIETILNAGKIKKSVRTVTNIEQAHAWIRQVVPYLEISNHNINKRKIQNLVKKGNKEEASKAVIESSFNVVGKDFLKGLILTYLSEENKKKTGTSADEICIKYDLHITNFGRHILKSEIKK